MNELIPASIEKSLETAKGFLQSLISPSIEELGLLMQDKVKLRRLHNQLKNIQKVKAIIDKEKIAVKQLNLKVVFPYLEAVALEEDEYLHNTWANLLVNYIDSTKHLKSHVYPDVLRQLSTDDIKLLEDIIEERNLYNKRLTLYHGFTIEKANAECLANLQRLGLVAEFLNLETESGVGITHDSVRVFENGSNYCYVTTFGENFYNACKR